MRSRLAEVYLAERKRNWSYARMDVKITITKGLLYAKELNNVLASECKTNYSFSYRKEKFVETLHVTH